MKACARNPLWGRIGIPFFLCLLIVIAPAQPLAEPPPAAKNTPSREELLKLGEMFARKIGNKMQEAEILLEGGDKLKLATLRTGNVLPEDEVLIFRVLVGRDKISLKTDIYGFLRNQRLMISLNDFVQATDLAISVSPKDGTATGWFIREEQDFFLDVEKAEVTIIGETGKVERDDAYAEGEDIFVSTTLLEKWFGLEMNIDLSNLYLQIVSTQQMLPVEERAQRGKRPNYQLSNRLSRLPLREEPHAMITTHPYLDVSINGSSRRSSTDETLDSKASWNVAAAGDLLGFTSRTYVSGNLYNSERTTDFITSIRQTFSQTDPEGNLLGPLHVGSIAFGDVSSIQTSFGGGGTTGLGVQMSNSASDNITSLNIMDVEGDALPGWEVELFRNDGTLGLQKIGDDGRYNFPSVFLFSGENVLRLVFYGPQGQIREETREIFSGANIGLTEGQWSFSAVSARTQLYQLSPSESAIKGDIHLGGRYEYSLGALGTGRFGFTSYTTETLSDVVRKNILQTGFSTEILDTLLSSDAAYDTNGGYASTTSVRRNFGNHQTGLVYAYNSETFGSTDDSTLQGDRHSAQTFLSGRIAESLAGFSRPSYSLGASYIDVIDGPSSYSAKGTLSGRLGSLGLGTGLQYSVMENINGVVTPPEDRLSGTFSATGSIDKSRWRLTTTYDVQPFEILSFTGQYKHPFTKELQGVAELEHELGDKVTRLDLSANWFAEKFTFTPRMSLDSENQFIFSANLRFSMAPNPYTGQYSLSGKNLTNSGGVASRVFMDLDGNGLYTPGEELMEEVQIRAGQSNHQAFTDKKGIAFIPNLIKSKKTDIMLTTNSLPDVYYISLEDGAAIIPRPGVTTKIDFPIVVAGEMDGEAAYAMPDGSSRTARNVTVRLVAPTGKVEAATTTAQDGFYLLGTIHPGFYYLSVETSATANPGYMLPIPLEFKPDGSTYFGQAISLKSAYRIPFRFSSTNNPPGGRKTRVVRPQDIASQTAMIHVGEYRSGIMLTLAWYKLQMKTKGLFKYFSLATPLADIQPDASGMLSIPLKPHGKLSAESAARACEMLQDIDLGCAVEIITTYHETVPSAKATGKTTANGKTG